MDKDLFTSAFTVAEQVLFEKKENKLIKRNEGGI
jgi:hypothetical protein